MLNLRSHRALWSVVGAFLVAGAGSSIAWSQGGRDDEPADVLLTAVEHSETSMRSYLDEVTGRFEAIDSTSDVEQQEELATALMQDVPGLAEDARAAALTAKGEAEAVALTSGGDLDAARDAYVAHIDAWIAEYDDAMVAPTGVVEIEPRVNQTFEEAVEAFAQVELDAGQRDRVQELLADE